MEGVASGRYRVEARIAPSIFNKAKEGDAVAKGVIRWAGEQLGELVNGVIRQLDFQDAAFDVVEIGGLFKGGLILTEALHASVNKLAPGARFISLKVPPVVGAVLLAMQTTGLDYHAARLALLSEPYPF